MMIADTSKSLPVNVVDSHTSRVPSAVATFSSLLAQKRSSLKPRTRTASLSGTNFLTPKSESFFAGPHTLPTEILLLIFQFSFEACIDRPKSGTCYPHYATFWLEDDPLSPSLFPYAPAAVCIRWLHVLSSIPIYWTRQVVTVDSHATSPIIIQTLFAWARNLPLQLIVARHPSITGEARADEYERVQTVLDLLRPHIHHTWSLTFNVAYTSSLPALWREQGNAQYLSVLKLMGSRCDTSFPELPDEQSAGHGNRDRPSLEAYFLREVTLCGHYFNDALMYAELCTWLCNITSLTICGYTVPGGNKLSLFKFISMVQICKLLHRLTLKDIAFDNDIQISRLFLLEAPIVVLRNLSDADALRTIISQGLGYRVKEHITISCCPIGGFEERRLSRKIFFSTTFVLEGISSRGIEELICIWNGENLSLIDCPGMSGSFLSTLDLMEMPLDLCRLRIVDCDDFDAANLIDLVDFRLAVQAELHNGPNAYAVLVELGVRGRGPSISMEQAAWLAEHVETFYWDTIASDGKQYVWDTSVGGLVIASAGDV